MPNNVVLRNYVELSYIMSLKSVEIDQFIKEFSLSTYEYNVDIATLFELQKRVGISLILSQNKISFDVIDENKYKQTARSMGSFFHTHRYFYDYNTNLFTALLIGRILLENLIGNKHVTIDELSEILGYSRSNLRKPIKLVREYLKSYYLKVQNVSHHGITIVGSEFQKRRAIIAIYNLMDINVILSENDPLLAEFFNDKYYYQLLSIIQDVMHAYHYSLPLIQQHKLVYYLIIQNYRLKKGYTVLFDEEIESYLKGHDRILKKITTNILSVAAQLFGLQEYTMAEQQSFEIMVLNSGFDMDLFDSISQKSFPNETTLIKKVILDYFKDELELTFNQEDINYCSTLVSKLVVRHKFGLLRNWYQRFSGKTPLIYDYPLVVDSLYKVSYLLSNCFGYYVPRSQCSSLFEFCSYYIAQTDSYIPKLNVAVTTRNNRYNRILIKRLIEKHANDYCEDIKIEPYMKLISNPQKISEQYDLLFVDQEITWNGGEQLTQKYICFNKNLRNFENLIRMKRNACAHLFHPENIISLNLNLYDKADIHYLCNLIQSKSHISVAETTFEERNFIHCNDVLFFVVNSKFAQENCLCLGELKEKVQIAGRKINHYLVFVGNTCKKNIHVLNALLYELAQDPIFFDSMVKSVNIDQVNERLNIVVK